MLILALVLLSPIQLAIQANAIAIEMTCVYFVCATVLYGLGFEFATNADWQQGAADFFWSCTDTVKNLFIDAWNFWGEKSRELCKWTGEQWAAITVCAHDYYVNAYKSLDVAPGSDGTYGFTADSIFTVELQNVIGGTIQQVNIADSILTFYDVDRNSHIYSTIPYNDVFPQEYLRSDDDHWSYYNSFSVPKANLIYFQIWSTSSPLSYDSSTKEYYYDPIKATGYSGSFSSYDMSKSSAQFRVSFKTTDGQPIYLLDIGNGSLSSTGFYVVNGKLCYFAQDKNLSTLGQKSWHFIEYGTDKHVAMYDDSLATDDYWDKPQSMWHDVLIKGGFSVPGYKSDVVGGHVRPLNPTAPDVYTGTDDVVIHSPIDKPLDEPTEKDYADVRAANPADIIEQTTTVDRPSDLPDIDSGGLATKFPFCIPYDLYNLFTGFAGTAAPPKFTIPFKYYKQDDGTYLIDYDIVIDFEQLSDIAYICRWFVGIEFVLGLIFVTRKLIGAQ